MLLWVSATAAERPRVLVLDSPHLLYHDLPQLQRMPYVRKIWRGELAIPVLGVRKVNLTYLEFQARAHEMMEGATFFSVTAVSAAPGRQLLVLTVTHRDPDAVTLANEAVNALLPLWLIEEGIDMYHIYALPTGRYTFNWNNRWWSFDQLTEALSTIVSAQAFPGGYMNPGSAHRVCDDLPEARVNGHSVYALLHHLLRKHGCNLLMLNKETADALSAFIKTAPRY